LTAGVVDACGVGAGEGAAGAADVAARTGRLGVRWMLRSERMGCQRPRRKSASSSFIVT
jgi:hypothetical protein